jgi:hypothetical protein
LRHEAEGWQRNAKNEVVFKNRDNNTKKIGFYSSSICFSARSNYDFFFIQELAIKCQTSVLISHQWQLYKRGFG